MEAIGGFIADLDSGPTSVAGLYAALSLMREAGPEAVRDAYLLDVHAAADLADAAEELSRLTEYWQLVAAAAVDRSRKLVAPDAHAVPGWTTGWQESAKPTRPAIAEAAGTAVPARKSATDEPAINPAVASDDGCRNSAEFLRARLRISLAEARSRLRLAEAVLPRQDLTGNSFRRSARNWEPRWPRATSLRGRPASPWRPWKRPNPSATPKRSGAWNTPSPARPSNMTPISWSGSRSSG